jgi:hypothetical protein
MFRARTVRELAFPVEHANHLVFIDDEQRGGRNRARSCHANGFARKAPFPPEIARPKNPEDGFLARLVDDRKLCASFLDVHDMLGGIALPENDFFVPKRAHPFPQAGRGEESSYIESRAS